ncbi:hypothetical protein FOZ63_013224, partial [Perkinsus olseni]
VLVLWSSGEAVIVLDYVASTAPGLGALRASQGKLSGRITGSVSGYRPHALAAPPSPDYGHRPPDMAGDDELTADEIEAARVAAEAATAAANGRTNEGDTEGDTESDKKGKKAAGWKSTADSPSETSGSPPTDWASSLASFLRISQDDANRQAAKAIPNLEALLQGTPHLRGMCHDLHPEDSLVKEVHSGSLTN